MRFAQSHEWISLSDDIGTVGISRYAQKELGEVVYVELPPVGKKVKAGEEVAVLESTKAAADIYAPVSGEIVAVNERLKSEMELLNQSPEKEGWLFQIRVTDTSELDTLLNDKQYLELTS